MDNIKTDDAPVRQNHNQANPILKQILGLIGSCFLIIGVFLP